MWREPLVQDLRRRGISENNWTTGEWEPGTINILNRSIIMYSPLQAASWGFLLLIANPSLCEDSLLHTRSGSFPELIGAVTGGFYLSFLLLIPVSWLIYNKICPFDGYGDVHILSLHWRDLGRIVERLRSICATQRDLISRNQDKKKKKAKTNNGNSNFFFNNTEDVLPLAAMSCIF